MFASKPTEGSIVGLDVGGTLFYFHASVLLQAGSPYLDELLSGSAAYTDERKRQIFFVDRPPRRFEYVRDYLVTGNLNLPEDDNVLRRNLREEAKFFGLKGLEDILKVSRTITPDKSNKGVLHWLGTERGKANYTNPYTLGAVHVGGWMDDEANVEEDMFKIAGTARSRESFVQYQLKPLVTKVKKSWEIENFSCLQWCEHSGKRLPVIIDLKSVQLRPTHYSLRVSECLGLTGDWNLEGSNDGTKWELLHAARDDDHLRLTEADDKIDVQLAQTLEYYNDEVRTDELAGDILLSMLEQDYRHTWAIKTQPKKFYRYFRIIGAGPKDDCECLHGEGLELYGDVFEE